MNIVTKTALANFRRNKSRNVLVGIAVLLTTILLALEKTAQVRLVGKVQQFGNFGNR